MKHAPSVVIVSWQRSEHGDISLRYVTCSVSCHRLMTSVRAWWYIPQVWNMLRQLSSTHDNSQSMVIYSSSTKHAPSIVIVSWQQIEHAYMSFMHEHAPSVAIVSWQRSEHGIISLRYESCSSSCHRLMTTDSAWLYACITKYESSSASCHHLMTTNRACLYVIHAWTCSLSCHRLMTTVRAWYYIAKVWIMLQQLSSSHDNGQCMVICMYH